MPHERDPKRKTYGKHERCRVVRVFVKLEGVDTSLEDKGVNGKITLKMDLSGSGTSQMAGCYEKFMNHRIL
jgi:hypothetical protein